MEGFVPDRTMDRESSRKTPAMIPSLDVLLYACVAKSAAILAEFARNSELVALGNRCIDCVLEFHSEFSHTCRNTTYTFLIDRPFVFFGIFDGSVAKTERFGFLGRIKSSFLGLVERRIAVDFENSNRDALQKEFEGIIQGILPQVGCLASESPGHVRVRDRDSGSDSGKPFMAPL